MTSPGVEEHEKVNLEELSANPSEQEPSPSTSTEKTCQDSCNNLTTLETTDPLYSVKCALKAAEKTDTETANIIQKLRENPQKIPEVLDTINNNENKPRIIEISPRKALAMFVQARLAKWQYDYLRDFCLEKGVLKYPSYEVLMEEKEKLLQNGEYESLLLDMVSDCSDDDSSFDEDDDSGD